MDANAESKRKWDYTLEAIAQASCNSIHTVREHRRMGILNPDNLIDVAAYIHCYGNVSRRRGKRKKDPLGGYDQAWGDKA